MKTVCGSPNRPSCPAATLMDATEAKPCSAFNRPPRRIWKLCWKPVARSRRRSAANSSSRPDSWASTRPITVGNLNDDSGTSVASTSVARAVTATTPIPSIRIASSRFRGIRATCRAASSLTSLKISASPAMNFILGDSESPCRKNCGLEFRDIHRRSCAVRSSCHSMASWMRHNQRHPQIVILALKRQAAGGASIEVSVLNWLS